MLTAYMQNHTDFDICCPEEVGITSASIIGFLEQAKARRLDIHSFMLLRHGRVAVQCWSRPYAPELPHHLYSFSKSITSLAVGIAIGEGLLTTDSRVAGFFPRRIGESADPRIYSMTVGHLLNMTSGMVLMNEATMRLYTDWVERFLNTPLLSFPGDKFVYNSMNSYMLSAILRRVTGKGLVDYLMPRLFEPLGIERPEWTKCPLGIECGGWGLSLKTEDMAKICQLCLDGGVWKGQQIVPQGWTELAGSFQADTSTDDKFSDNIHNRTGYGYHFWLNGGGDSYRADGMFGQYGVMLPKKDTVIIITAAVPEQMKIIDLLWDTVVPAIDSIPEKTNSGGDYAELCALCENLAEDTPLAVMRSRMTERKINDCRFAFPFNTSSLLPLAVRYLEGLPMMGIDWLRFNFADDRSYLTWYEDGCEHRLDFGFDGDYTDGMICIGQRDLPVKVFAAWISDDTLEIDIHLIHTPHTTRAVFRFDGDEVIFSYDESPSVHDSMKMIAGFTSVTRSLSERFAAAVAKVLLPLTGKATAKD